MTESGAHSEHCKKSSLICLTSLEEIGEDYSELHVYEHNSWQYLSGS